MKEILREQDYADISVTAAFRKQVTNLLRINVVYQIVEDHEARSTLRVVKVFRDALVETDVLPQ